MYRPNLLSVIALGGFTLSAFVSSVSAECTREKLLATAEKYIAAQKTGKLEDLQKLFATTGFAYQENNKVIDISKGVISQALNVEYNRSTADTTACATFIELVANTPTPYVIGTQLRLSPDASTVTMVDSIVATTGALFFNSTATLGYFRKEDWKPLEGAARPSRDVLQKAIDAYLDLFGGPNAGTAMAHLPFGTPCQRIEGSRYVDPCTEGIPRGISSSSNSTKVNSMRRYVIDEVLGSADVLCSFTAVGNIPDSHELRIENGKIRYVHTITLCAIDDGPDWGPTCRAARAAKGKGKSTATPKLFSS